MFKFRRPSLCSSESEILDSNNEQKSNAAKNDTKPVAVLESRSEEKKGTTCSSSPSLSSLLKSVLDKEGATDYKGKTRPSSCRDRSPTITTITVLESNGSVSMCDRKRKERHESTSQEHDNKVIKSGKEKKVEKTEAEQVNLKGKSCSTKVVGDKTDTKTTSGLTAPKEVKEESPSSFSYPAQKIEPNVGNNGFVGNCNELSSKAAISSSVPVLYTPVTHLPSGMEAEAEAQRKLERSVDWMNPGVGIKPHKKSGHRRKHRSGSNSSQSSNGSKDILEELLVGSGDSSAESSVDEDFQNGSSSSNSSSENTNSIVDSSSSSLDTEAECLPAANLQVAPTLQINEETNNVRTSPKNKDPLHSLDFSTLHHQVESNEPIGYTRVYLGCPTMADQVILSPRSSFLMKESHDHNVAPSPPINQAQVDPPMSRQDIGNESPLKRLNILTRQVSNLKRHLKTLEEEYEQLNGYKPSHADKLNNKEMRKCLLQLTKAKRDLKQLRDDPASFDSNYLSLADAMPPAVSVQRNNPEFLKNMTDFVREIEFLLTEKRRLQGRPEELHVMSALELMEEKNSMQKQLLSLERKFGRPGSKQEREVVRDLYDRYRTVKRLASKALSNRDGMVDLVPIIEHVPLELEDSQGTTTMSNSGKIGSPFLNRRSKSLDDADCGRQSVSSSCSSNNSTNSSNYLLDRANESFHDMNLNELETRQKQAKEEKRRLRSRLKQFEIDFQTTTGRPPQKEEKYYSPEMELEYQKYKRLRATLRLLEVLIAKRNFSQLNNKSED